MSVSRRFFFKGLLGGLGSVGLANFILSKQGWLGFFQPTQAHADIPPPYITYGLRPHFHFFEGRRDRNVPIPAQNALGENVTGKQKKACEEFASVGPIIIEYSSPSPAARRHIVKTYDLSPSAAFVTRLLLMGVDTSTLAQMYVSRFGVQPRPPQTAIQVAQAEIDNFINTTNFFQRQPYPAQDLSLNATISYQYPGTGDYKKFWADFSIGSVFVIGGISKPI